MKKSNGIIAYTIIIAIVIALIFFFQRSLYTQTNVTYSQYRSFVEEEKIAQAQIEQNAKVPTGSVLFFVSGSSTEYRVFVSDVNAELDRLQDNGIKVTIAVNKSGKLFSKYTSSCTYFSHRNKLCVRSNDRPYGSTGRWQRRRSEHGKLRKKQSCYGNRRLQESFI